MTGSRGTVMMLAAALMAGVTCIPVKPQTEQPPDSSIPQTEEAPESSTPQTEQPRESRMLVFHNGTGPMCLEALAWLETVRSEHPDLVIEEHLTTQPAGLALFRQLTAQYAQSQGVSTSFGYLPVIFFSGQAFSGFSGDIRAALEMLIAAR